MIAEGTDYFVRTVALPHSVDGVTVPNSDGTFDIYLNEALGDEARRKWLSHEIEHIRAGHFYKQKSVSEMEREAEGEKPKEEFKVFSSLKTMYDYYWDYPIRVIRDYYLPENREEQ